MLSAILVTLGGAALPGFGEPNERDIAGPAVRAVVAREIDVLAEVAAPRAAAPQHRGRVRRHGQTGTET